MTSSKKQHPERRPVDQVEGAIHLSDIEHHRLVVKPEQQNALSFLVQLLCRTADRQIRERSQRLSEQEAA